MNPDTSVAPYFDDFNSAKNFDKILFRGDRGVQVRELNQLQTMLKSQIGRFGDNIFKQGSVVSGCHVNPIDSLPFVKIKDQNVAGVRADVAKYNQLYVKNNAGTIGVVLATASGFENTAPDLNTLFVRYISSGASGTASTFNADDTLTIYNPEYVIEDVSIVNGSSGFTNGDQLTFIPAIAISNTTGGNTYSAGLYVGDIVSNGAGANVVVNSISGSTVTLKPITADLNAANTAAWNISPGTYVSANTGQSFVVQTVYGSSAAGRVTTNGNGSITDVTITSTGAGYSVAPTPVVVSTSATSTQKSQVNIAAQNYKEQVTVTSAPTNPIGNGYGVTIDEGIVYQNQSFTRTDRQFVIVSKYSTTPTGLVVGFTSSSDVVTYLEDPSLLDNASGYPNATAPGADRLRVTATPVVMTLGEAATRTDFVSLVEFSDGEPVKTADQSSYNAIGDAIAQRTYEQAGNFVTDPFLVNTKSAAISDEPTTVNIVVDPGTAYINGYRVSTDRNYLIPVNKGTTTTVVSSVLSNVDYGNYVVCSQMFGRPTIGQALSLTDTAFGPTVGQAVGISGNLLGYARVRGVKVVGNQYYVYLYDVALNSGVQFSQIRSLSDSSTITFNVDTTVPVVLNNVAKNRNIFPLAATAIKHVSNVQYQYQKQFTSVTVNTAGYATLTVTNPEKFPVAGTLSATQAQQVIVVPSANIVGTTALGGTVSTTASSNTITGSGTTLNTLTAGQYVSVGNTTSNTITQVVAVTNATSIVVSPAPTTSYTSVNIVRAAPANVPVALSSVTVSGDQLTLVANLGFTGPTSSASVITNVGTAPTIAAKTVTRNAVARINASTNIAGTTGPWCLGQSDIIRLRNVYAGANTTFTSGSAGVVDVTTDFYIDANQTPEQNGLGYLYQKPSAQYPLSSGSRLLVVFDVLRSSSTEGRTVDSYPILDGVDLPSSVTTINTVELPEVNGPTQYFDTRDSIDFRPFVANTVALQTAQSTAPINPTEPTYGSKFAAATKFPAPDTTVTSTIEYYLGRNDLVLATADGSLTTISGQPGANGFPDQPVKSITINKLVVPPYPTLPAALSSEMAKLIDTKIANDKYSSRRVAQYTVSTTYTPAQIAEQQPRRYQMSDIGSIDRRVSAVEYSLALTMAETQTSNRNITSANSSTTDRFKFGFFVDSFTDDTRSDITNPQYTATIVNNVVQPRTIEYVVSLEPQNADTASNGVVSIPYTSQSLIGQLGSTDGAVVPPPVVVQPDPVIIPGEPAVVPVVPTDSTQDITVVKQTIETFMGTDTGTQRSQSGLIFDVYKFTLSAKSGLARLMLNCFENQNAVEVFQSSDPNFVPGPATDWTNKIKNSLSCVNWSTQDRYDFRYLDFGYGFKNIDGGRFGHLHGSGAWTQPAFENTAKIEWSHDPANGLYYTIRITKFQGTGAKGAKGHYRFAFVYPKDYSTTVTVPGVPLSINYNGQYTTVSPEEFTVGSYTSADDQQFYTPPQTFVFTVNGLKPNTSHQVYFNNVNVTAKCQQVGKNTGDPIITGADGSVVYTLYYDGNTSAGLSEFEQQNAIANLLAGPKVTSISDNNQSFAVTTIQPKQYVSTAFNSVPSKYGDSYFLSQKLEYLNEINGGFNSNLLV